MGQLYPIPTLLYPNPTGSGQKAIPWPIRSWLAKLSAAANPLDGTLDPLDGISHPPGGIANPPGGIEHPLVGIF